MDPELEAGEMLAHVLQSEDAYAVPVAAAWQGYLDSLNPVS